MARFGNGMCQLALGNDFVVGNGGDAVGRRTAPESAGVAAAAYFAAFCVLTGLPLDAALGRGVCVQCQTECGGKNQGF